MQIKDLLARNLDQKIEEIIQVDQTNEQSVYNELTEYVATDRIREQYHDLLKAIAEARTNPDEGVGVWISGFFGSGKSSFAKNLGYVLANRTVLGRSAANLFKQQVDDSRIEHLVDFINATIPTEVVMFDVQKDKSQGGQGNMSISPYMYRVLLRELGYAQDFDVAELEIGLEGEDRLPEFIERFNARYANGDPQSIGAWTKRGRSGVEVWNRAGAILHEMDPITYPAPESFARNLAQKHVDVTPRLLVERAFELTARRRPEKALVFIIDEVGQYVAYSQERLEDLRAVVELFGRESKNRVKARKAIAPIWLIVTAQEKLDEVTSAMGDDKRVLLAKVRDRFHHEVDLSPADIREVATRRVLSKTEQGEKEMLRLFEQHQGQLNAACRLERTSRKTDLHAVDFAHFYPYLPHYIELSIDIMAGIRLQPGAMRHIGGSNRTIIGQVYQMLVNQRTNFAAKQVGALVSLDKLYELIEGQVGSTKQKDINDIADRFKTGTGAQPWESRVAKALGLLEFVRDLPRTETNIAAVLVDEIGKPAPVQEVKAALARLEEAQFVRNTEEGYKLQTAQEKNWTIERSGFLDPRTKEKNEIRRELLGEIFSDNKLRVYSYRNLRNFRVGITVDGVRVGEEGEIPLALRLAEDGEEFNDKLDQSRTESRLPTHQYDTFWVFELTPEIDTLVKQLFASRQMINRYSTLRSQGKITAEESTSLANEQSEAARIQSRLRDKISEALATGQGLFHGVSTDGSLLGKQPSEIFKKLWDHTVPSLYPKLELGAHSLKGNEAEEVLKAANLNALPQVFYKLGLVKQEGPKFVPDPGAPIAKEVLDFLKHEHGYGNKVTGKTLDDHFQGIGYGWDRDMLRLVLAVLLRAGAIEVTHQGRRFRNHQDPQCRVPFANNPAFRGAGFAPRESIDLKTLIAAVRGFEQLTGDEVDVEEGAIANALKKWATEEMNLLLPIISETRANQLPGQGLLDDYRNTLLSIQSAASDDGVRILAGEGNSLKTTRDQIRAIRAATTPENLDVMRDARTALDELWPVLKDRTPETNLVMDVTKLQEAIESDAFFAKLGVIAQLSQRIRSAYRCLYLDRHEARYGAYTLAITGLTDHPEWASVQETIGGELLSPLRTRACMSTEPAEGEAQPKDLLPAGMSHCVQCHATVSEMESDLVAVMGYQRQVLVRLEEAAAPLTQTEDEAAPQRQKVVRVRLADFFVTRLDTVEAVDTAIGDGVERLRAELYKRVAEGVRIVLE